jgi:Rrf2 family protein
VKFSTRSRYGTRLVLDLARNFRQSPVRLAGIAQRQNVSIKYLEQIIRRLKKAGYVSSTRGPKGGHTLTRKPQEISVGEIVALLEGGTELIKCAANPRQCRRSAKCATRFVWQEAARAMYDRMNTITFGDLLNLTDEQCREDSENRTPGTATECPPDP